MNVLIVGGGKSGAFLAQKLSERHHVTVVERRSDRVHYLESVLPGVRVLRGDGCEPSVLDRAGVAEVELVAALTGDDEDNLVVSFLSKMTHRVPMVFARTNHPKNDWMFTPMWGVDVAVSTASTIYGMIEKEARLGDVIKLIGLSTGELVIDDLRLAPDSAAVGSRIADLVLPERAHIMAILSDGEVVLPRPETVLFAGDEMLILSEAGGESSLRQAFGITAG